jgi:hypothetical protein
VTGDSLPGVYSISQFESAAKEQYILTLRHVLTSDPQEMASLEEAMQEVAGEIDAIVVEYEKTITRARDRELFEAIRRPRDEFLRVRGSLVLPPSRENRKPEALALMRRQLDSAYQSYTSAVRASVDDNKQFGDVNGAAITAAVASTRAGVLFGVVAALLAGCGLAFLIVRTVGRVLSTSVSELAEGAQQVAAAAGQVSGAAQSLSQGATEQAASLEETSASMEEMASMTRKNAENGQQAAVLMAESERLVEGANGALGDMVASMTAIKESSDKVAKILKTIDEIAFQTNILALNAAVEAARAGEAGMGFAVVADEVRALAQRSAQAAKDTAGLIEESIVRSGEGQQRVQVVAEAIGSITASTVRVKALVDQVSEASRQQSQGIEQVTQAIAQMEKVTQGTAATAEESAAASEELNAQAEAAMGVVGRLAALVGSAVTAAAQPAERPRGARPAPVVTMAPTRGAAAPTPSAEDQLPLTGTFGRF